MKLLMRIITKTALNWLDCIGNNTTFNKKTTIKLVLPRILNKFSDKLVKQRNFFGNFF